MPVLTEVPSMAKTHGVYADERGGWYFKATLGNAQGNVDNQVNQIGK